MKPLKIIALSGFCFTILTACSNAPSSQLFVPDFDVASNAKRSTNVKSIQVASLDLPGYAEAAEIPTLKTDGSITADKNTVWADEPERAFTELLAEILDKSLNAKVAGDPWPFAENPDVRVSVKVTRLVGRPGSNLSFKGQFFLSSPNGGSLEVAERFEIDVPVSGESVSSLPAAYSAAFQRLSDLIADKIVAVRSSQTDTELD